MTPYKCPNPDCKYTSKKEGNCCGVKLVKVSGTNKLVQKLRKVLSCCGSKKDCCD